MYNTQIPEYMQPYENQLRAGVTPAGFYGTMGANTGLGSSAGASSPWGGGDMFSDILGGAGIGSLLGGLFGGGGKSPMSAANPYFQQALQQMYGMQGQLPQYYQPYMQAGQWALPMMEQQYSQLLSDPGALMNKIGGGFKQSPGYDFQLQQALGAANRAAAAGGMAGSPAEQAGIAQTATGLANQDYYNYLSRALGLYQTGLGGLQNLGQMGLGATGQLAQGEMGLGSDIANIYGSEAQLAAAQQQAENQAKANRLSGWGSLLGGLAGGALHFI